MAEWLFLVPKKEEGEGAWQQASIDGTPVKTKDPHAYAGMPLIFASDYVVYISWEDHIAQFRPSD